MPSSTMHQIWIPPEVLISIFNRLPVRTLTQLQWVCKDWKNRLNDPSFIQEHLRYSAHKNPSLLFHGCTLLNPLELYVSDSEMQVLQVESVPSIEFLRDATVIGSINGLLCLTTNYDHRYILFWNPAIISKFRLLTREANFGVKTGFGFCSIVKDYKLVCISYLPFYDLVDQVEVYSLSTCLWKKVEFGELLDGVKIQSDGFSTNGAIFWFGYKGNGLFLISYHIATEEFALIPSPISAPELSDSLNYRLSVYENKLALLSHITSLNYEYSLIDLWVMEEGQDSISEERWSWKYSIKHPYLLLPGVVWRNMIVCHHIDLVRERNTASEHNMIHDVLNIVLVNLTTDEVKRFAFPKYGIGFRAFNYVESLLPVDKIYIEEL